MTDIFRQDAIAELYGLIEALNRRTRRLEQAGEAQIAVDAAALRDEALRRIRTLAHDPLIEVARS